MIAAGFAAIAGNRSNISKEVGMVPARSVIALLVLSLAAHGQELRKIELHRTTEVASGMAMAGGGTIIHRYYANYEGENRGREVTFTGNTLREMLHPASGAAREVNVYAAKGTAAIFSAVGMTAFAILAGAAGVEETGETANVRRVTPLGYSFVGLTGVCAAGALYCHLSKSGNLRRAIRVHNDFLMREAGITYLMDY